MFFMIGYEQRTEICEFHTPVFYCSSA